MPRLTSRMRHEKAFVALCRQGMPRNLIAAKLGWTIAAVAGFHQWLQRTGRCSCPLARSSAPRRHTPSVLEGRQDEIRALFDKGFGCRRIARRLGVTANTVVGFVSRRELMPDERKLPVPIQDFEPRPISSPTLPMLPPVPQGKIEPADVRAGAWLARMMEDA